MWLALALIACEPVPAPLDTGPADTGVADTEEPETEAPAEEEEPDGEPDPFDPCPPGVTCTATFPFVDSASTLGGSDDLDAYACAPSTDESGPERVYRLDLAEAGFVAVSLSGLPAGVDVDVHLLGSLDAADCVDRGHWAAGALLEAGSYHLVVDSWDGEAHAGAYTVTVGLTTVSDLAAHGMDPATADRALRAFDRAWADGETDRFEYGIVDFAVISTTPRFWVVDLADGALLYELLVAHGSGSNPGSDPRYATVFSNVVDSHMSSLGLMRTAETYHGQWGYSLRLDGLEPTFNGRVRERAIVLHGADWASQDFVDQEGYLGLSWGCPTVDSAVSAEVIDTLKGGALLWSHYPDPAFLDGSAFL